ncbi:acyl carrier protein [Nakamurella sp.]|uniref:acyl carrier protein n=1 Tax=Nakamurella sp. TaxID=1869182 RepID=UPI003784D69E
MDLLSQKAGLPAHQRTDRRELLFIDLDLDSLAFLQLQGELKRRFGVELPDDRAQSYTLGEIVDAVDSTATAA